MGSLDYGLVPWLAEVQIGNASSCLCGGCSIAINPDGDMHAIRAITDGEVRYSRSVDGGVTWDDTQLVAGGVRWWNHAVHIVCDSAGSLFVFYVDANDELHRAKSTNNGGSWITSNLGSPSGVELGRRLWAVVSGNDHINIIVRDSAGPVWHRRSTDGGASWSSWTMVDTAIAHLEWATNLQVAVDSQDKLYVIAEAIVSDARTTYLSTSTDGGASWSSWSDVWHGGGAVAASIVATGAGKVQILYVSGDDLVSVRSSDSGVTWNSETAIAGASPNSIFDQWSSPGFALFPDGSWHGAVYRGGSLHKITHIYKDDFEKEWAIGQDIIVGALWKTPSDISIINVDKSLAVLASVGSSETIGKLTVAVGVGSSGSAGGNTKNGNAQMILVNGARLERVDPDQIAASASNNSLVLLSVGTQFDGSAFNIALERKSLELEPGFVVQVNEVWPELIGDVPIQVQVGSHPTAEASPTWNTAQLFDPVTQSKIDVRVSGRYIAIRFFGQSAASWRMAGYAIRYEVRGKF